MYQKNSGGKPPKPSAPPFLQILDPPLILQPLVGGTVTVLIPGTLTVHIESPGMIYRPYMRLLEHAHLSRQERGVDSVKITL